MIKVYQQVSILNPDRTVRRKGRRKLARSFVKGFIYILARQLSKTIYTTKDILGADISYANGHSCFTCNAGGGKALTNYITNQSSLSTTNDAYGIVVGSGTTAVGISDNALAALISHGITSGKLEFFGMLISNVVVSAPSATFTLERIFRNSSGGNVDVKEIGLYGGCSYQGTGTYISYCLIRDVLGATVTVTNGQYLKVTYTISITA